MYFNFTDYRKAQRTIKMTCDGLLLLVKNILTVALGSCFHFYCSVVFMKYFIQNWQLLVEYDYIEVNEETNDM